MTMERNTLDRAFSFRRIWCLLRNRLLEEAATVGIGAAVVVGLNLLGLFFAKRATFNAGGDQAWTLAICLGGLLLASSAFKPMHDGKAGTEWLLLPASSLEKYLAALAEYALVLPLALSAAAAGASALLALAERAMGGPGLGIWTPMEAGGLAAWGEYAVAVSVFLAGSASFRKAAFLKTVGIASAYVLVVAALLGAAWIFFPNPKIAHFSMRDGVVKLIGDDIPAAATGAIGIIFDIARYALVPLFSLIYGWAKVAEKEARDEVQ